VTAVIVGAVAGAVVGAIIGACIGGPAGAAAGAVLAGSKGGAIASVAVAGASFTACAFQFFRSKKQERMANKVASAAKDMLRLEM
jgi:outer membrane lipoprotein SlyB